VKVNDLGAGFAYYMREKNAGDFHALRGKNLPFGPRKDPIEKEQIAWHE